ncbi:interferon-induced protein 44-like [Triplophysa dalaica]|uniref:interferon-induced protein 44-like n=1 Tax=Triplophysa dalaica TaxID=1582913 RepID=UPI0024DFBE30|nr:interferon-induced protein 44-like [Triplophysa dalaica]XP_056591642.1 interferon-induced protein 44-like [Triplophysa dalaica]
MWPFTYFRQPVPPPPPAEFDRPWRTVNWSEPVQNLLRKVDDFQPGDSEVDTLRILLHGPAGAGKSSFINSVDTALQGHITTRVPTDAISGKSFTLECKTYNLKKVTTGFYPFTFTDTMGIQATEGIQTDDIIKILHGQIRNDYVFNPVKPITKEDSKYNRHCSLKDRIHCLVSVFPANQISSIPKDVIRKMREIREKARDMGIPQAIIMTKVDETCPLVKENLEKVYTSKKIKEMVQECSVRLGITESCIYPVKNYHEEDATVPKIDILILKALINIVNFANDYVEDHK